MKSDKEIVGTLLGFDDFVSILAFSNLKEKSLQFKPGIYHKVQGHDCTM